MLQLGKKLKEMRKAEGMTQEQLAEKLQINRVNYTRYETDVTRPDYETLIAIADFYNISLDEMLGRDERY
ncbi:MAG: helix-turn-helix transcriptional regulator [Clostridia bacterium]|nr:helix-turn-helix transcriptional regulator [Clostridia bacterium]